MPDLRVSFSEEGYARLCEKADSLGLSPHDFIRVVAADEKILYSPMEVIERARNRRVKDKDNGETFTLPGLYGDEWKPANGVAGVIGKRFFNYTVQHPECGIQFDGMVERGRRASYKFIDEGEL